MPFTQSTIVGLEIVPVAELAVVRLGWTSQAPVGTPVQVYGTPVDTFVADVVGPSNFLPVTDATQLRSVGPVPSGPRVAMIRPDRIVIGSGGDNQLTGVVQQRLYLGGHYEYLVTVGPALLRVLSSVTVAEGDAVTLSFAAADCIILPNEETPTWA